MKKILSLIFCAIFLLSLAACGGEEAPATNPVSGQSSATTQAGTASDATTNAATDAASDKTDAAASVWGDYVIDTDLQHRFLATDIKNHSIVIFDLNRCRGKLENLTLKSSVVWEWDADNDPNCKIKPGAGIDSAKLRYSPYYKKDVIIACSSSGWAGVIDYKKKTVLWEYNIGSGPHSIEMMPDSGDVVVAGSGGNGILAYVPLSAGQTRPSHSVPANSGHGVSWDPQNKCLWVLTDTQILCYTVKNEGTKNATLVLNEDKGGSLYKKDSGGHVLSPVLGQPGKYWVSAINKLWQFNAADGTVTNDYPYADAFTHKNIKGMASFEDGTAVQTFAGMGKNTTYEWSSRGIKVFLYKKLANGTLRPVTKEIIFENREFYKVFPLTKEYQ